MDSRADWNDEGIKCTDCRTWISAGNPRRFHSGADGDRTAPR